MPAAAPVITATPSPKHSRASTMRLVCGGVDCVPNQTAERRRFSGVENDGHRREEQTADPTLDPAVDDGAADRERYAVGHLGDEDVGPEGRHRAVVTGAKDVGAVVSQRVWAAVAVFGQPCERIVAAV